MHLKNSEFSLTVPFHVDRAYCGADVRDNMNRGDSGKWEECRAFFREPNNVELVLSISDAYKFPYAWSRYLDHLETNETLSADAIEIIKAHQESGDLNISKEEIRDAISDIEAKQSAVEIGIIDAQVE